MKKLLKVIEIKYKFVQIYKFLNIKFSNIIFFVFSFISVNQFKLVNLNLIGLFFNLFFEITEKTVYKKYN